MAKSQSIQPFRISVPSEDLDDLRNRLERTRFSSPAPEAENGDPWAYGVPLSEIQKLVKYWREEYNWRDVERRLNETLPQFTTPISVDGFGDVQMHFVFRRSARPGAVPLLFIHGWPGSFLEVSKIVHELANGGEDVPSFHVVAPSLPNFGFSQRIDKTGFDLGKYAEVLHKLMKKLGFDEYVTQGGDWGSPISRAIANQYPDSCKATHLNMDPPLLPNWLWSPFTLFRYLFTPKSEREKQSAANFSWYMNWGRGYFIQQESHPQTLGYALTDSPVGLLSWIYDKIRDISWDAPELDNHDTDKNEGSGSCWKCEDIITWICVYWFSTAGPESSLRIYYEVMHSEREECGLYNLFKWYIPNVKLGVSYFPKEVLSAPKAWARARGELVFQREWDSGGHFAAWERPKLLIADIREMFGKGGGAYGVIQGRDGY